MARDFIIPVDQSRVNGIKSAALPTVSNGGNTYILKFEGGGISNLAIFPTVYINIPFTQQINGPISLKNTGVPYKIDVG